MPIIRRYTRFCLNYTKNLDNGEKKQKNDWLLKLSTVDQDLEKNKHEILELANTKDFGKVEWVEEKVSGKKTIYGWTLSISKEKGFSIFAVKGGW